MREKGDRTAGATAERTAAHDGGIPRELLLALMIMAAGVILLFDNMRDAMLRAGMM